jgi:hypothetical protein
MVLPIARADAWHAAGADATHGVSLRPCPELADEKKKKNFEMLGS